MFQAVRKADAVVRPSFWIFFNGFFRFAVPFGVGKMMMGVDEIIDGEVFLAIEETCAASDDLLEFDHRVDRAHENDVADVARVHTGGEFLGSGQDGGNGLFVILKLA